MSSLPEKPIFVVGSPRSGTTLLRFILSSHSRLYIPSETGFIPHLDVAPGVTLSREEVTAVLDQIGRLNREWAGLVDDVIAFYRDLPRPTLPHLLDALYRRRIRGSGAARWGDKTPGYVLHIPRLHAIFPTAQFIHIIRDGRDVTLSAQRKWGAAWYMDSYYMLRRWVEYVETGRENGRRLGPGRYLEIHYEHLVTQPETQVARICTFLEEEMHPAMLQHDQLAQRQIGPEGHVEVRNPISRRSVYRWSKEMSPFAMKLANEAAGETLDVLGYEPSPVSAMTQRERWRLYRLALKYALTQNAQRLLTRLGWLSLNRGKRR
jgi:hypothetical protein